MPATKKKKSTKRSDARAKLDKLVTTHVPSAGYSPSGLAFRRYSDLKKLDAPFPTKK
jgi:hypothetical protein